MRLPQLITPCLVCALFLTARAADVVNESARDIPVAYNFYLLCTFHNINYKFFMLAIFYS